MLRACETSTEPVRAGREAVRGWRGEGHEGREGGAVSQSATTILDDLRMLVNCSLELTTTGAFDMVSELRPGVDVGAAGEEMNGGRLAFVGAARQRKTRFQVPRC